MSLIGCTLICVFHDLVLLYISSLMVLDTEEMLTLLKSKGIHMDRSRSQDDVIESAKPNFYRHMRRRNSGSQSGMFWGRRWLTKQFLVYMWVVGMSKAPMDSIVRFVTRMYPLWAGANLRFGAVSGVNDTSSETAVTVSTTRIICISPAKTRCQCRI